MQSIPAESLPHMSVGQYLDYEQQSGIRHELVDGYLYAMAGASDRHLAYQQLPTLQEYLLISQDEVRVEVYRRDNGWQSEVLGQDGQLQLQSIDFICPVRQLYERTSVSG